MLYFPPHLINASALPCETENTEIVSFHVNVSFQATWAPCQEWKFFFIKHEFACQWIAVL